MLGSNATTAYTDGGDENFMNGHVTPDNFSQPRRRHDKIQARGGDSDCGVVSDEDLTS